MKILVTGGAGYIGSVAVKELIRKKESVVVIDNLSKGKRELVDKKAEFYKVDLVDKSSLEKVFKKHKFDAVIHFSSYKAVGESMENAVKYSDNIVGMTNLLNIMVKYKVQKIIFSSSAAVYGMPKTKIITESHPLEPINFYGYTKLAMEKTIEWYHKIHNIDYVALRYFNVAGDGGLDYIDPNALNIFPVILEVMSGKRECLTIFGKDYKTKDGTCIRDYVDVNDLVDAHILALRTDYNGALNLGTGKGFSVMELVNEFMRVSGKKFRYKFGLRRAGDPGILVASNRKAKRMLNWNPKKKISDMIKSTFKAYGLDISKKD
ncbi:UDP-glucose 4-epimerase GalE [Candidatus Woesearchaeota archaeon]|nr:UDP-glucose 4-epimerase GalE [Candidatus Woesearchaeota archaeon]